MGSKMQAPEVNCMNPENYRSFFRALCWKGTRKSDRPFKRRKDRRHHAKVQNPAAICFAPALLANPSQFAVYSTVRRSILARWKHLYGALTDSDDSDDEPAPIVHSKVPKVTGIGLRAVFTLVSQSRTSNVVLCEASLKALLDVVQGYGPEELAQEPTEIISHMHRMLTEVASGSAPPETLDIPNNLTALGTSCLLSLVVARGEVELILNAISALIMSSKQLAEQYIQIPVNLTTLQRSVQSVILGTPSRNMWLNYGVPQQSLTTSFPVELPSALTMGPTELVVRALVSDGCYLYVFTSRGLLKIGSGYGGSIKQHVYLYKPDFFPSDRHGWLGFCKNKLYVRIGRKKTEVYEVDKNSLEVKYLVKLESGIKHLEPKSAVFTDGHQLGIMMFTSNCEYITIRLYDTEKTPVSEGDCFSLRHRKEINVPLLRKRTLALGRPSYEDMPPWKDRDKDDLGTAIQLDDYEDDPLVAVTGGAEFGLLTTEAGRVYYTGKGASLGYKAVPHSGRWTLIKETLFTKNLTLKKYRPEQVLQVAVGHEGVHAILVLDNGQVWFTGVARRDEDGDTNKHRRLPKPTRPKKMYKAEHYHIIQAACNNGSTALVARTGELLMFGKDAQHSDSCGVVHSLRNEKITQVALGKAHTVALTSRGLVYTFGINNKGQCGREFGYTKEKQSAPPPPPPPPPPSPPTEHDNKNTDAQLCLGSHSFAKEYSRVCVRCRKCTGFGSACTLAHKPPRGPGERCGCGEGDRGCRECGICRVCADAFQAAAHPDPAEAMEPGEAIEPGEAMEPEEAIENGQDIVREDNSDKEKSEGQASGSDVERDMAIKITCLPPARVAIPGGHKITAVACGLHHTLLITDRGEVLSFGSNQYGQLGAGDIVPHHKLVKVKVPKSEIIAAGSYHSAVMTREGEIYTFGNYQKGALGRMADGNADSSRNVWYATPAPLPRIGPKHTSRAVWVSASGDQTFIQISQSVVKTETLFSSTIIANSTTIIMLPNRPEHTFKCLTIDKNEGTIKSWSGPEQVDFVNTLACLDPLYDVIWCYQPQMRVMKCYNILAFDSHKLQRCCNPDLDPSENVDIQHGYPSIGTMRRLEDFKNLEDYELISNNTESSIDSIALADMSILNQELAIPTIHGAWVTRMHIALHLLGCLDSLIYVHDNKLHIVECKREVNTSPVAPLKADWLTVTRFETHGGGWGYSGHSVEAIRFMCDTDILLGGFGLFGGRGDYTAKIKLYDIGSDGGDHEGDGDLIAESEEVVYECAPRDRFPVMFDAPLPLISCRWYVAWACINGPSSDCGSAGQAIVINEDASFHFKTSKKSNNGTDVNAGQIPSLLYNLACSIRTVPPRMIDVGEPIACLTRNLSRKLTVPCFKSLLVLLKWSWDSFRATMLDTHGLLPINYQKLITMKHQKQLVYIIRACLRLLKSYVLEIYPSNFRKQITHEYMTYLAVIQETRVLIQGIMAEDTPTCAMLTRRSLKNKNRICYVQFALDLSTSILKEAHETTVMCFDVFYPAPTLRWNHLCWLLHHVKNGKVPTKEIRELTATSAALCTYKSLRDILNFVVPITQRYMASEENERPDSKVPVNTINAVTKSPMKAATAPRSANSQQPPPIPPRANQKEPKASTSSEEEHNHWHILDVIPIILDIVMNPIKQQMMTRPCGQPHDHGEIKQKETLADNCCKLVVRIVAELTYKATNVEDMKSATLTEMVTPSRFMRVNTSRSWNTGNGSPDAICFNVDRSGIVLVGVGVYSGGGIYEYTLELLHDMGQSNRADESGSSNCWVSVVILQGTFDGSECQNDMAMIKLEKHILLKEELRYALRFFNHGGRTSNGDCGLPSVKGPDGTTFRFASCSLSFNGTTLARGQIPCLIYSAKAAVKGANHAVDSTDALQAAFHTITLRVSQQVLERSVQLFRTLRNELTAEDLKRNISVLQQSPIVKTLIPYVLANLETIEDSKNLIKLLELIHQLLPHVAAVNMLVPNTDEFTTTTTNYYTWVESEHPYKHSTITNMRVLFPSNVSWILLEMDPRSVTAQPEDTLTIYAVAGTPKQRCHCLNDIGVADPPFRKRIVQLTPGGEFEEREGEAEDENACMHFNCTYVSVTPKLSNLPREWPQKALLIPGNEVIFALETATDYLAGYNRQQSPESRFGFRCLCAGYEDAPLTSQREGLVALEMELVYSGAIYASKLLAPDLDVPPMVFSTLVDAQIHPITETDESQPDSSEALLLSRGLELSSPLSVHQVLDGQSLLRCVSTERQFLTDFIAGAESTAGGRLARWLAPTSRVEPSKCEIKGPTTPAHPADQVILPILIRDQYGAAVTSPSLKVEVVIQKHEESSARQSRTNFIDYRINVPKHSFQPPVKDKMFYQAISMMRAYSHYSFEELRLASGVWGDAVNMIRERVPAERMAIKPEDDGSYLVNWVPKQPGSYKFRCTLDDLPIARELLVDVTVSPSEASLERGFQSLQPTAPTCKVMYFDIEYSAGLRVRASPSLQAEELGLVASGNTVAYVEELTNKDGTWVRLNLDSIRKYTDGSANVAWCLKHHEHLDKALLALPEPPEEPANLPPTPPPEEGVGQWPPNSKAPQPLPSAPVQQPLPSAPVQQPLASEPVQQPLASEPVQQPLASEPVPQPVASAPVPQPVASEPVQQPVASAPVQQPLPSEPVLEQLPSEPVLEPLPAAPVLQPLPSAPVLQPDEVNPEPGPSQDPMAIDEGTIPNPIDLDTDEESNGASPYAYAPEPSKRDRHMRNEAAGSGSPRRSNGNEWWAPLRHRPDNGHGVEPIAEVDMEPESDVDSEPELVDPTHYREIAVKKLRPVPRYKRRGPLTPPRKPYFLMTPEELSQVQFGQKSNTQGQKETPLAAAYRMSKERTSSAPPLPARPPRPPMNHALSPAQAECLRAIFAALLWHEGIVHDSIACAAFLKFHPELPKQGAEVLARPPPDVPVPLHQRHSVEVSNTGNYLRIQPSTLDCLPRSAEDAGSSAPGSEAGDPPPPTQAQVNAPAAPSASGMVEPSAPAIVNVLPPAMRALVALWDALYDSDQLSAATDKYKKRIEEIHIDPPKVMDEIPSFTLDPPEVFWPNSNVVNLANGANTRCELCGGTRVAPPVAAHMRHVHPGCRTPTMRGYDRMGYYRRTDPPPDPAPTNMLPVVCGQLIKGFAPVADPTVDGELWYIFCERCRDKGLKLAKMIKIANGDVNETSRIDHNIMKENAIFLLDLAPLTNAKSLSTARFGSGRSPPTPPASLWQPAPSFQCMRALGADTGDAAAPDTARYHSLGRAPLSAAPGSPGGEGSGSALRVPRSVSMGQASDRELANAVFEPIVVNLQEEEQETLSGAGSSLISQPSAELLRLVGCVEEGSAGWTASAFNAPNVNTDSLVKSPVLSFALKKHDLPAYRQKLDAAVRISTVRQFAFEAMNWLMRSTTQPMGVHDVMWWFCAAVEQYALLVPPPENNDEPPKEAGDMSRINQATASTSAICPGGRSARGARAALHAFLGSVSALAPSLPVASAAALQAMRCWALHYSKHDRNFLHRSQVFTVISKILSHPEDGIYEDGFTGAFAESFHSLAHKESYLWSCPDVTAWCDISVSSRQAMAGCLVDGSTETFWESGEEDRNKAKWIQLSFSGGTHDDSPHIVCVHIDNSRDTTHKTLLVSFLYSGGTGEMYHMQDIEIDPKLATWICYTLPTCFPGTTSPNLRVRCELRGPEPTVRVRQVRMLAMPTRHTHPASAIDTPYKVVHALSEKDTLRVFRLLTAQVFGNLLAWDNTDESVALPRDDAPQAGSDLREHVVGILFAGNQLTTLQRQVMTHIVEAIGGEAARVRDDWESAFLCAKPPDLNREQPLMPEVHQQDNYCFEMLSLLLALSGSRVGRAHLSQQVDLLWDLLTLLHIASDRVQRQVIFLLRRMMTGIPPQKLQLAKEQNGEERYPFLQHLVCYLAKAINIQVKAKGPAGPASGFVMMGSCVAGPDTAWFMRGRTTKKHAQLIIKFISDMAEGKISTDWSHETRTCLARYAAEITQISEADRHPSRCIALPTMWMCLAALSVCEQSHIDLLNKEEGRDVRSRNSNEPRTLCANHDDGTTVAVIECQTCGDLCAQCDRFLHLKRSAKAHCRQVSKEEEGTIRIDIQENCGRAKLFWLLLVTERKMLKGLAEFREGAAGEAGQSGVCRFCGTSGNVGLLALGNVCSDLHCQEYARSACSRVLSCGHLCKGVRDEPTCLPCLSGCSEEEGLRQDGDDMCMICFTDPLQAAPSIQLGCGHLFHLHCCKEVIASRWNGPRITFSFTQCPICKVDMKHWTLESMLEPIRQLHDEVKRKALMRFGYEGIELPATPSSQTAIDPAQFAMDRYAYYVCHKCQKAYFGGLARCEAENNGSWDPSELVCGACSDVAGAKICPKHSSDFLEYKCRYCCSVAVFFCFGTTHFCNPCHDDFQRVTNMPREELPQCPTGPKCVPLPGTAEECPLQMSHPPTGDEFALGCGICRHGHVF